MHQDEKYMRMCFDLAKKSVENGNEPFGAVLVKDGKVVHTSLNKIITQSDPTHHAELALIREYTMENDTMSLEGYTLYTSCEPCFMCSGAMVWSKLSRLVYSAGSGDLSRILKKTPFSSSDIVFNTSEYDCEITKYVLRDEGIQILQDYFG